MAGFYSVIVADASGCRDTLTIVIGITTHINQNAASLLQMFPNPAQQTVYIKNISPNSRLFLYNTLGQMVWKEENSAENTQIDVSNFAPALYWLRVETNTSIQQLPLLKSND